MSMQEKHGEDAVCVGLALLAWLFGPVHWVVQRTPGLSEADLSTHVLAFKEYGLQFVLVVGTFNVLYLSFPYLRERCSKAYRQVRQWCLSWNESTKTR